MTGDVAAYVAVARRVSEGFSDLVCSFVSGSLVEGIGNPTSDLDVFVITRSDDVESSRDVVGSFSFGEARIEVGYTDDTRVDTEVWTASSLRAAARELAATDPEDRTAAASLDESRLQLAHRVRVGVPAVNPEMFSVIHAMFDYDRLARVLTSRALIEYLGFAEDAAGAIQDGDGGTALLTSRLALGAAVDAVLAVWGDTNAKPKWRVQKLRRHGDPDLLATYLSLEAQAEVTDEALLDTAKRRLRAAGRFAQRAQDRVQALRTAGATT